MAQYLPLFVLLVLAATFGGISILMSRILMPPRPTAAKTMPYECGVVDLTEPPERFPVRFFLIAMIFVIFDIEIIFYYPFTMVFRELGAFGMIAILIFSVAVFESFVYLISNGALDWGPARHVRRSGMHLAADRTTQTTIRRVGNDGREAAGVGAGDAERVVA
ncbi:MAG: NADH-quinone oxidoreductase subunit A [Microthrixaceae bacterium]